MIAIIPARGGSKGLPSKNILEFDGKPLITYSIEQAKSSKYIDRVIVSTDNQEIIDKSKEAGAEVPFVRPSELASDDSSAIETYKHAILEIEEQGGESLNAIVVLLPTSPLRLVSDIDRACELFMEKKADSVVSYTQSHHPIEWFKNVDASGRIRDIGFGDAIKNRQEYSKSFRPNGSIYIFKKDIIVQGKYYTDNSYALLMPKERSIDIDSLQDFLIAQFIYQNKNLFE